LVTTNIKDYSDGDVTALIDGLQNGEIPYTLNELKKLLSEVTNRKLDAEYVNALTELMHGEITGDRPAPVRHGEASARSAVKRPVQPKDAKKQGAQDAALDDGGAGVPEHVPADPVRERDFGFDGGEPFPVLSFLSGFYKGLAWAGFVLLILAGAVAGYIYFQNNLLYMISAVLGGIILGTVLFVSLYARAETIALRLRIERYLRRRM
jgi:hypothetical protein